MPTARRPIPLRPAYEQADDRAVRSFTRAALCAGLAGLNKSRLDAVARRYAGDRDVELILRAAVTPTSVAGTPALSHITVALLDALVPLSAAADLLRRGIGLNFDGAAQITVPGIALPNASFVGEGQPIPVRQATTSTGPTLNPFKFATICVLTGEMMRNSNAETLIRQVLLESVGPALDAILLSNSAAVAGVQPAGLLNGITALTASTATDKAEACADDLETLVASTAPVAGNGNIILILAAKQAPAVHTRLPQPIPWPLLVSSTLPAGTAIMVAANAVVSAIDGVPAIDTSTQAEIQFETNPQPIVGSGGVVATPVGTLFQADNVGLRLRWPLTWALRDTRGIAYMTGVNW